MKLNRLPRLIPAYQLTLAVIIVILYLTLLPQPFGQEDFPLFPGADKIVHACMFGGLVFTYLFERHVTNNPMSVRGAVITAILSSTFGILIEFLQQAMNMGRSADLFDALADIAGAFLAIPVCIALHWVHVVVKYGSKK